MAKKLRLNLNNWPAVASHLFSVLLGIVLSNFTFSNSPKSLDLPKNSIIVTLSRSKIKIVTNEKLGQGDKIFILKSQDEPTTFTCRINLNHFVLLEDEEKFSFTVPLSEIERFKSELIKSKKTKHRFFNVASEISAQKLPFCSRIPRVSYAIN